MNRRGRNTEESFLRVQDYLTQHPLADAPATLGVQAAELSDVIKSLSAISVDQEAGVRGVQAYVQSQRQLRNAVYADHMLPISRVAREVFGATGMDKAFRVARPKSNQQLLAAAGAMAEAAVKQKDEFEKHGLPQDFIEQLQASAKALEDARAAQNESGNRKVRATATLHELLKRGRRAVRLLNAILRPRLAKDPELLTAWDSARNVRTITPPLGVMPPLVAATLVAPQAAPATNKSA